MEAMFWMTLLLHAVSKVEPVGSRGLKNHEGKLFFSLSAVEIYFKTRSFQDQSF